MPNVTGSKLLRVLNCQPSGWLPQGERHIPGSRRGTFGHAYCAARRDGADHEHAMAVVPVMERAAYEPMMRSLPGTLWEPGGSSEVTYAYNWRDESARVLGRDLQRQYDKFGLKPSEIPGTIDVAAIDKQRHVGFIQDLKFINESNIHLYPTPMENPQFLIAALSMLMSTPGLVAVEMELTLVVMDDQDEYERTERRQGLVGLLALQGFVETVGEVMKKVWEKKGDYAEGPWCDYCPAFSWCELKQGILRGALLEQQQKPGPFTITDDNAKLMLQRILSLEKVVEVALSVLKRRSDFEPFHFGGDSFYGPVPEDRRSIDPAAAEKFFDATFPGSRIKEAIKTERSITQTDLAEVFAAMSQPEREAVGGGSTSSFKKSMMVQLEAAGAVHRKTIHKHKVYTDKARAAKLREEQVQVPAVAEDHNPRAVSARNEDVEAEPDPAA